MGQVSSGHGSPFLGKYWYFVETWYCVLCGKTTIYRERKPLPKPEKYEDRHKFEEYACDCKWQL